LKMAERYGVTPTDMVGHMENTFAAFTKLIDEGIIDAQGNLVSKGEPKVLVVPKSPAPGEPTSEPSDPHVKALLKKLEVIETALGGVAKKTENLESSQYRILHSSTVKELKELHPKLSEHDISRAFSMASRDPKLRIWDAAKIVSEEKELEAKRIRDDVLKTLGQDPEKYDENLKRQQDADAGSASFLIKGKKLGFRGKGVVTPLEATQAFLSGKSQIGG